MAALVIVAAKTASDYWSITRTDGLAIDAELPIAGRALLPIALLWEAYRR
jgi:hypothetical protein